MRLAILSDIHGNDVAFAAVLADLAQRPADQVICLGDAIQGGPQPGEVARRLRELGGPVVMGNADAFVLSGEETGREELTAERRRVLHEVREWTFARLSADERDYLRTFTPTVRVALDDTRELLGFHGSPTSFDDLLLPDMALPEFLRVLGQRQAFATCGGHVHLPFVRRIGDSLHFNPGSIGFAYRHGQTQIDPWAEYALLSLEAGALGLEFRRVPYDVDAVIAAALANGRPHAAEFRAQFGR